MKFNKPIKIYLFKSEQKVSITFRVSDVYALTYHLSAEKFEELMDNWQNSGGHNLDYENSFWFVQYKKHGPRPERLPDPHVRVSISKQGIQNQHRVSYDDMIAIHREYFFQKNNKMYWDDE
jgi:hypothetical protein